MTNSLPGPIDKDHLARLERLAGTIGVPAITMASGAGHDSAVFGRMGVATAMIFIRNYHSSHNPKEEMAIEDFAEASRLLHAALDELIA